MSEKTHANVAVRLPAELVRRLEQMQADAGARSIAPVVEKLIVAGLNNADTLTMTRQPLGVDRRNLFLRTETVERLRAVALDHSTEIGSVIYSMIAGLAPARSSRPLRSTGDELHAQAA